MTGNVTEEPGSDVGSREGRRRRRAGSPVTGERGAVTAEAAAALPLLVAVTLALVWLLTLATAQVRVVDAAREAARLVARGEPSSAAVSHARRVAPSGTTFSVTRSSGDRVVVVAAAEVRGPGGLLGFLPGVRVDATSVAAREPR